MPKSLCIGEVSAYKIVLKNMGSIFKKQRMLLPSATGQQRGQGYCFLFVYWDVSDCFCGLLDATDLGGCNRFQFIDTILGNLYGIGQSRKQLQFCYWQIKNNTLAGSFDFVGFKMAFTIGKSTEIKSHFRTYKNNENTTDLTSSLIKQ